MGWSMGKASSPLAEFWPENEYSTPKLFLNCHWSIGGPCREPVYFGESRTNATHGQRTPNRPIPLLPRCEALCIHCGTAAPNARKRHTSSAGGPVLEFPRLLELVLEFPLQWNHSTFPVAGRYLRRGGQSIRQDLTASAVNNRAGIRN